MLPTVTNNTLSEMAFIQIDFMDLLHFKDSVINGVYFFLHGRRINDARAGSSFVSSNSLSSLQA